MPSLYKQKGRSNQNTKTMSKLKYIGLTLTIMMTYVSLVIIVAKGLDRQEKWECTKWELMEEFYKENFEGFYWSEWQTKQCKNL